MHAGPTLVNRGLLYASCVGGTILLLLLYIYMGNNSGEKKGSQ